MSFPVFCGRWGNLRRIRRPRMKIKNKISHNFTIAPTGFEFTLRGYHHRLIKGFFTGISKVKVPPTTLLLATMRVRNGKNERPHRGARGFIIFSRNPHTYIHIWCAPKACGQKKGFWKKTLTNLAWTTRNPYRAYLYTLPPINAGEQEVNPFVEKRTVRGYNDINYTGYYVSRHAQYIRVRARTHLSYLRYRFPVEKQRRQRERRKQNLFSVLSCVLRGNIYTIKCVCVCMYVHTQLFLLYARTRTQ